MIGPFPERAVSAELADEPRPTTVALESAIERRWREAIATAARDQRELFDGAVLRWLRHVVIAAQGGRRSLRLTVGRSTYREFVGTNLNRDLVPDAPDPAGGPIPWSHFGNAVGTSALVATPDAKLHLGRRSARVFGYSGHAHPFGGILESSDADACSVDLFSSMRRELTEELALDHAQLHDLELTGAVVEPAFHQPELLFRLRVPLTSRELEERFTAASSRHEHTCLVALPDDEKAIEAALERAAPVSPVGRACVALHFAAFARVEPVDR